MEIENVSVRDGKKLRDIYAYYVVKTAVSFEYKVPSVFAFCKRILKIKKKYPYIKVVENGEILGYAYATSLKKREAYCHSCEVSIYVRHDKRRMGAGRLLYGALEETLRQNGINNTYACIAYNEEEDTYLMKDSILFHEKTGFRKVGLFSWCGYKFGRYYDIVWMEKKI